MHSFIATNAAPRELSIGVGRVWRQLSRTICFLDYRDPSNVTFQTKENVTFFAKGRGVSRECPDWIEIVTTVTAFDSRRWPECHDARNTTRD